MERLLQKCSLRNVTIIKSRSILAPSIINQCVLDCHVYLDCDMQNGFSFGNCLTGMQISAEIHSTKNKTGEINTLSQLRQHILGGRTLHNSGYGKRKESKRSRYPDSQPTPIKFNIQMVISFIV